MKLLNVTALLALSMTGTAVASDLPLHTDDLVAPEMSMEAFDQRHTGYASIAVGGGTIPTGPNSFWAVSAAGRYNFNVASNWSLQTDVWGSYSEAVGHSGKSSYGTALHLSKRNDAGLIGVYGSYGQSRAWLSDGISAGINFQKYFAENTLYGQVGYVHAVGGATAPYNGRQFHGHLALKHFHDDNTTLQIDAGFALVRADGIGSAYNGTIYRWGAEWERQFKKGISAFVQYKGNDLRRDDGFNYRDHTALVGVRFGNDSTLRARDRRGASLYDMNSIYGQGALRN